MSKRVSKPKKYDLFQHVLIIDPKSIWQCMEDHGWHDPSADLNTDLLLVHSEVSEACEAARKGLINMTDDGETSVEEELADVVIRVFHIAAKNGFDITTAVSKKHHHNVDRPHRHGGKLF